MWASEVEQSRQEAIEAIDDVERMVPELFRVELVTAALAAAIGVGVYVERFVFNSMVLTPFMAAGWLMSTGLYNGIQAFKHRSNSKRLVAEWRERISA